MGIRYWSSDVCSSDLLPLGGVLAVAAAASLRGQGPGLRDRRIIFVLGWLAAALVAFLSVGTFYNNYALIVMPMLCVTLGAVARPKGLGRSEEHTSELQSLMRISYPVFCLKKKNPDVIPTFLRSSPPQPNILFSY